MTLPISDTYRASVFLLTFWLYTLVFFIFLCAPQLIYLFLFFCARQYKGEVVLTYVVLFAVCTSLQLQQLRLLTNPMARPVSLTAGRAERSMGITVNALSCFCRVVECLLQMDTPVACFPCCQTKTLSPTPSGTAFRSQAVQSDQSYCPENQSASVSTVW